MKTMVLIAKFAGSVALCGMLLLLWGCPTPGSSGSSPTTVTTYYAYVANTGSNTVSTYSIDPSSGAMNLIGSPVATAGIQPDGLAVTPNNSFLYVKSKPSSGLVGYISAYSIGTNGLLTPLSTPTYTIPGELSAYNPVITPNGAFLYVDYFTNAGSYILAFSIGANGLLTQLGTTPLLPPTLLGVVTPNGAFLYGGSWVTSGAVLAFSIGANGLLTQSGTTPLPSGTSAPSEVVTPNGSFFYAFSQSGGGIFGFSIGSNGALTPLSGLTGEGTYPGRGFAYVTPNGSFFYMVAETSSGISQYSISSNGSLAPLIPAGVTFASGFPVSAAVTPNGSFLVVTASVEVGLAGQPLIYCFPITSNGTLGTPTEASTGVGPFGVALATQTVTESQKVKAR
jgi:6-phosphogluconolactonase (cycloisomerase 2 family)